MRGNCEMSLKIIQSRKKCLFNEINLLWLWLRLTNSSLCCFLFLCYFFLLDMCFSFSLFHKIFLIEWFMLSEISRIIKIKGTLLGKISHFCEFFIEYRDFLAKCRFNSIVPRNFLLNLKNNSETSQIYFKFKK